MPISLAETDLALVQLSRADHGKHPSTVWYCNIARTKVGKGPRRSPDTAQAVELSEYIEVLGVCTGTLDTMEPTRHDKVPGHTRKVCLLCQDISNSSMVTNLMHSCPPLKRLQSSWLPSSQPLDQKLSLSSMAPSLSTLRLTARTVGSKSCLVYSTSLIARCRISSTHLLLCTSYLYLSTPPGFSLSDLFNSTKIKY